jgi:hypothetical protein
MSSPGRIVLRDLILKYQPHRGLNAASLVDKLVTAPPGTDPWSLDLTDTERGILGRALAENPEPPTASETASALAVLVRNRLKALSRDLTREIAEAGHQGDQPAVAQLLVAKRIVRLALNNLEAMC